MHSLHFFFVSSYPPSCSTTNEPPCSSLRVPERTELTFFPSIQASSILSELGPSAHDRFIKAATLVKAEEEAANIKRRERRRRGVAKLAKMGKKVKNCVGRMVPKRRTGVKALDDLMKHVRIESEGWLSVRSRTTSASSEPQVRFPID